MCLYINKIVLTNNMKERIRETFYNIMYDIALDSNWVTYEKLHTNSKTCKGLIILTIIEILNISKNFPNEIILFDSTHLTSINCPSEFKELFGSLIQLKKVTDVCSESDSILIKISCMHKLNITLTTEIFTNYILASSQRLMDFANVIYEKQIFHEILAKIADLFQSVKTNTISEKLIRDTFYNMMVNEALETSEYVSKSDLENAEAFIFLDLSAFTIITECNISKNINGLGLMDGSILNIHNCPDTYKEFAEILLKIKPMVCNLNQSQITALKKICSSNPSINCPDKEKTAILTNVAANVTQIATKVSQRSTFKDIIVNVINFCIEIQ